MLHRAHQLRDKETATTSSFPSRAVTCATVYSFVICYGYLHEMKDSEVQWWMPIFILAAVLLASYARINMGVHYPSDCIAGFIQGFFVALIATLLWKADIVGCNSCVHNKCYARDLQKEAITATSLERVNLLMLIFTSFGAMIFTVVSILKPIDFWGKCDRVYGMLFPGIVFQLTFLCPKAIKYALPPPVSTPWYSYIYGIGVVAIVTAIGLKVKGRHPIIMYIALFISLFVGITGWRLWVVR